MNHHADIAPALGPALSLGAPSQAAVLLALYLKDGQEHVLLNKRTHEVVHHKGEVCLPGGVWEPGDQDLQATALREAREEMGIEPADVHLLGTLSPVQTRSSGFSIQPIVGRIPYPYPFRVNAKEVAQVLEVPVATLLGHPPAQSGVRPQYRFQGHVIWGATATILARFLEALPTLLNTGSAVALQEQGVRVQDDRL